MKYVTPLLALLLGAGTPAQGAPLRVEAVCAEPGAPMGEVLRVRVQARQEDGSAPAGEVRFLPFVDGKRWGHHAMADEDGSARLWIPMPRPGSYTLQVAATDLHASAPEFWMWPTVGQGIAGPAWFQRAFRLDSAVKQAVVWAAADDEVRLHLNGVEVAHKVGWSDNVGVPVAVENFRKGENLLSAWGNNGGGPAGVLLRLEIETEAGTVLVVSDDRWRVMSEEPTGWPGKRTEGGVAPGLFGRAGENAAKPRPWPSLGGVDPIFVDPASEIPEGAALSNAIEVTVAGRDLVRPPKDPDHLVGVQWETWFTPKNAWWTTAQGVPLLGFYNSLNRDITRQHLIWFIESGVDFVMADWSNHIWFSKSWNDIGPGSWEIINATTAALDELAAMRDEGHDVPKFTLLTGISHVAPPDGPRAVNEQLAWIHDNYVANPKYAGLWQEFEGKPLIMPLNLGATYLKNGYELDGRFCIRYMGAGTDHNEEAYLGLWSWMDHAYPGTPMKDGVVESMTASVGCFEQMGWLGDRARGRRNGATLVEDWNYVLQRRPMMVQLHQFNEFLGAREGQAHGPGKDQYFDSYSIELSDDIEPVALDQAAYRCEDGYGFYYLNLARALVALYREESPETTVLAIQRPTPKRPGFTIKPVVREDTLELVWTWAGKRPESYAVSVDGKQVLSGVTGCWVNLDLTNLAAGEHRVRVTGEGTKTHYPLLWDRAALPLADPVEAAAEVVIQVVRERQGST